MTVNFPNWMPANSTTKSVAGHTIMDLTAYAVVNIRLLANPAPLKQVRYQHTFVRALEA
tara:strand:+ start:462 stop:638 length:177 start_codon:yes stop_codon:yes gene_type:complete